MLRLGYRAGLGWTLTMVVVSFLLWEVGDLLIGSAFEQSSPLADGAPDPIFDQVHSVVVSSQVAKVGPDGRRELLLGPVAAAAAFGGMVLLVGGAGAVMLWRRADADESRG